MQWTYGTENQSLPIPMGVEEKSRTLPDLLCDIGFKQIEIGFPSAAQTEFDFARKPINDQLVPDGVPLQVLTQAREHLIRQRVSKAFRRYCQKASVRHMFITPHLQCSRPQHVTSGMSKEKIKNIAVVGALSLRDFCPNYPKPRCQLEIFLCRAFPMRKWIMCARSIGGGHE